MGLFKKPLRHRKYSGLYLGSHSAWPDTAKHMLVDATSENVTVRPTFNIKNAKTYNWDEIIGFDFTGEMMNGVFTSTLYTITGDWVIEVRDVRGGGTGSNPQRYAEALYTKLTAFKLLVAKQTKLTHDTLLTGNQDENN
jgi:hypothetical protein